MPHAELPYQVLVGILDVTRSLPLPDEPTPEQVKVASLFPVVVFSKMLEAEPAQAEQATQAPEPLDVAPAPEVTP